MSCTHPRVLISSSEIESSSVTSPQDKTNALNRLYMSCFRWWSKSQETIHPWHRWIHETFYCYSIEDGRWRGRMKKRLFGWACIEKRLFGWWRIEKTWKVAWKLQVEFFITGRLEKVRFRPQIKPRKASLKPLSGKKHLNNIGGFQS
jgi:hypothetical protein